MITAQERSAIVIAAATETDASGIAALLRAAHLPHEDFESQVAHFLVARDRAGKIVGAVGAEVHAPEALLRSLVVAPEYRGTGLGDELVRRLEVVAENWGVQRWWLLTATAGKFFAARGFVIAPRTAAPPAIQQTRQFSGGCCSSAVCLSRARKNSP